MSGAAGLQGPRSPGREQFSDSLLHQGMVLSPFGLKTLWCLRATSPKSSHTH